MRKLSYLLLLAVLPASGQTSELPHPTSAQFNAALETLNTSEVQWVKAISSVKVEELPVSYSDGKLIEDNKDLVVRYLVLAETWEARVEREHSLYAEVNLALSIQQLQDQMFDFATMLSAANMPDRAAAKKLQDWAHAVSDIATGPLGKVNLTTTAYVTDRAHQIDQSCAIQTPAHKSSAN